MTDDNNFKLKNQILKDYLLIKALYDNLILENTTLKERLSKYTNSKSKKEYYQRNRETLRAKARAKYQADKKLGKTQHQIFMKSVEPTICCPHCNHFLKKSNIKQV